MTTRRCGPSVQTPLAGSDGHGDSGEARSPHIPRDPSHVPLIAGARPFKQKVNVRPLTRNASTPVAKSRYLLSGLHAREDGDHPPSSLFPQCNVGNQMSLNVTTDLPVTESGACLQGSARATHTIESISDFLDSDERMDNIYEALRESHEIQRTLCRSLARIQPQAPKAQDVFRALRLELAAHAAAEERFLYATILMDDIGLAPSRHALAEHHEIDECVEALEMNGGNGEAWQQNVRKLSHKVHHHLREEETKFFQISGKVLTEAQKVRLAGRYRRDLARMKIVLSSN